MSDGPSSARPFSLRALLATPLLAALAWMLPSAPLTSAATTVDIPDASLRHCVLAAIGQSPMTAERLASITSLQCTAEVVAIGRFDGIEYLTGLQNLTLRSVSASELGPLAGLPALRTLLIQTQGRSAKAAFDRLTHLSTLTLVVRDSTVEGLALPPALISLELIGPKLTSLTDLPASASVENLSISVAGRLTDLTGIAALSNLRHLSVNGVPFSDASPVSQLHRLRSFAADESRIADLTPLSALADLRVLSLNKTPVTTLEPLRGGNLSELAIDKTAVTNVDALTGMHLTKLSASGTPLATSRGLGAILADDAVADLSHTGLTEVAGLSDVPESVTLDLRANHIRDFGPLPRGINTDRVFAQLPIHLAAKADVPIDLGLRRPGGEPVCPVNPPWSSSCHDGVAIFPRPGEFTLAAPWFSTVIVDVEPTRVNGGPDPSNQAYDEGTTAGGWPANLWDPLPQSWHVEWYRDSKLVSSIDTTDIQHAGHAVTAADVGHRFRFCITAFHTGLIPAHMCSQNSDPALPAAELTLPRPKITGTARSGHVLIARTPGWPADVSRTYQWFRNDHRIRGAVKTSYRVTKADKHKWIELVVTATKSGYTSTPVRPLSPRWIR